MWCKTCASYECKLELEHVPTVRELAKDKLAHPHHNATYNKQGEPSHWAVTKDGQKLIYAAQALNAARWKIHHGA